MSGRPPVDVTAASRGRGAQTRGAAFAVVLLALVGVPTAAQAQTESVEYYGLDALGSVRVVFDAAGAIVSRMDYGPFGQELLPSTGKQQQIYAGLFADGEAGLDHADAREYQVRTGRFNSVDPVYSGLFEPQRWNRYAYAANAPSMLTDPEGLDPFRVSTVGCKDFPQKTSPEYLEACPAFAALNAPTFETMVSFLDPLSPIGGQRGRDPRARPAPGDSNSEANIQVRDPAQNDANTAEHPQLSRSSDDKCTGPAPGTLALFGAEAVATGVGIMNVGGWVMAYGVVAGVVAVGYGPIGWTLLPFVVPTVAGGGLMTVGGAGYMVHGGHLLWEAVDKHRACR